MLDDPLLIDYGSSDYTVVLGTLPFPSGDVFGDIGGDEAVFDAYNFRNLEMSQQWDIPLLGDNEA